MRRTSILLAATCVACAEHDNPSPPDQFAAPGCDGAASGSLVLSPELPPRREATAIPASLVALSPDSLLTVDGKSAGVSLYLRNGPSPVPIAAPEPLYVLARVREEVLAAGAGTIYRVRPDLKTVEALTDVPLRTGSIISLAGDESALWVSTGSSSSSSAELLGSSWDSPHLWARRRLAGPVRLEALGNGRVAAATIAAPHRLSIFDTALRLREALTPPARRRMLVRAPAAAFTQALVLLDCGRLLHVVADLRSDRRLLHLYSLEGRAALRRSRTVEAPFGFAHSLPQRQELLGVWHGPGWWEAVWMQWSWKPEQ